MSPDVPAEAQELLAQLKRRRAARRVRDPESLHPLALAWLALPPVWTAEAALSVPFPLGARGDDQGAALGRFLDAVAQANLLEVSSALVRSGWEIWIRPVTSLNWRSLGLSPGVTRDFVSAGLLLESEIEGASTPRTEGTTITADFQLPIRDTLLRSSGLRFPVAEPWLADQVVDVEFRPAGTTTPAATYRARTLGGGGSEWQGWTAAVGIASQLNGEPDFLVGRLYHEFRVSEERRAELLEIVSATGDDRAPRSLQNLCREISERLQERPAEAPRLPEALGRWCQLVKWFSAGTVEGDRQFTSVLRPHLQAGHTGEAAAWVSIAETLTSVFGGEVETVVRLGRRRLELCARADVDRRYLRSFFARDEQLQPLRELLAPEPSFWALHYLGGGGVGKTMLLRHLVTDVLPKMPGGPVPYARIDFDDLNADYPLRRPAQLLLELASGLRAFGDEGLESRTESKFHEFRQQAELCHVELEEQLRQVVDPRPVLDSPVFVTVVNYFCDFLSLFRSPAILILDTCEELARIHGEAGLRPAVEATFKILEMVHARVGQMAGTGLKPPRVIFAGRRLLAVAGEGWEAAGDAGFARASVLGEPRPYLRVEVLRGFTRDEAHQFLTEPKYKGPPADATHPVMAKNLEEEVFRHSPESLSSDKVKLLARPPAGPTELSASSGRKSSRPLEPENRYNPFDLSLYADWYNDEPSLTGAELKRGGADPYVRNRIVQRLKRPDVLAALPFLVELRRVACSSATDGTRPLLQRSLALSDNEFESLRRELCQLEWLDYQTESRATVERIFLSVDRNLLPRFQRFLAGPEWHERRDRAREALRPFLKEHMASASLENLEASSLSAALRLLPRTEAAWGWAEIEMRIVARSAWGWAANMCRDIVSAAEAHEEFTFLRHGGQEEVRQLRLTDPDGDVSGHVRATLAAAVLHTSKSPDLRLLWERVRLEAQKYEVPELSRWLYQRALFGGMTSQAEQNELPDAATLETLSDILEELERRERAPDSSTAERQRQVDGSALAAVTALLELADRTGRFDVVPSEALERWLTSVLRSNSAVEECRAAATSLQKQLAFLQQRAGKPRPPTNSVAK